MFNLAQYWERRYADGRDSGEGSRGDIARVKGELVNRVVDEYGVWTLLDWGCGDGQVLAHITDQIVYTGIDISPTVLANTALNNPGRSFVLDTSDRRPGSLRQFAFTRADMSLSMDVMFHQVLDVDYYAYLENVFGCATKVVLIWSTDHDEGVTARHVHRRHWTPEVARCYPQWKLESKPEDPTVAGPYLYRRAAL